MARQYCTRRCTASGCGLRFPLELGSPLGKTCPRCGAATEVTGEPYQTHGIHTDVRPSVGLEVLLDNIRSLRNVGSMFRTADGVGVGHMHLGGVTPTPDHPKLAKTALGAERTVPWTHYPDATIAAAELVADGKPLWALEGGSRSESVFDVPELPGPIVLVCGHEVSGVDPRILDLCERVIHLPMLGTKDSLNVSVAFGIAAYALRFRKKLGRSEPS